MSKTARALTRLFLLVAFLLRAQVSSADPIVYTHALDFPTIQGFGIFTEGSYLFPSFSSISLIRMIFSTTDPDFNGGVGPTGGDPGIEIGVISPSKSPPRFGIVSVVPGNQAPVFYASGDPLQRFEEMVTLINTGTLTVSLGAFENFPGCCSAGFTLDQPSSLTLEIEGQLAANPVPERASLILLGTGLIGAGVRRWRQRKTEK